MPLRTCLSFSPWFMGLPRLCVVIVSAFICFAGSDLPNGAAQGSSVASLATAETPALESSAAQCLQTAAQEEHQGQDRPGHSPTSSTPQLELERDTRCRTSLVRDDLVLHRVQGAERSTVRTLPSVQQTLGGRWMPKKRKSRSKSRSHGKGKVKDQKEEGQQEEDVWQVFPNRAPWITSTPSRTTSMRTDVIQGPSDKESALAKQSFSPIIPPTVAASENLTSEETKKLEYLRGLSKMGIELTQNMVAQLEALQIKEQKVASAKVLSHGHLNRYNKLRSQVESSAKKVVDLDKEWVKFMANTMEKNRTHASMYQSCRADLLENHNQKLAELHAIKQEVIVASMSLVEQVAEDSSIPAAPSVEEQMQLVQEIAQKEGNVMDMPDQIDLTSDFGMDEQEEMTETVEAVVKKAPQKAFRSATSPLKVANLHLKQKQDPKEPKAKQAEEK